MVGVCEREIVLFNALRPWQFDNRDYKWFTCQYTCNVWARWNGCIESLIAYCWRDDYIYLSINPYIMTFERSTKSSGVIKEIPVQANVKSL